MSDPNENAGVTLPNGHRVRFRSLRRGELEAVRELCARLSLRTRYLRFLSPMPVLPESLLHMLADVDEPRRLTLIAELDHADGGHVVGLGNMAALDHESAELGLVVADCWQRQGIGVALAARLLDAADRQGFQRFVVHGRWDNPAFRRVLSQTADVLSESMRYGESEVMFVRRRLTDVSAIADRDVMKARG